MGWLNQTFAVTVLNLKSIRQRLGSSLVAVATKLCCSPGSFTKSKKSGSQARNRMYL